MNQKNKLSIEQSKILKTFIHQLKSFKKAGARLTIGGIAENIYTIANTCIREEGSYMGDFITNEEGELVEVRYDKII